MIFHQEILKLLFESIEGYNLLHELKQNACPIFTTELKRLDFKWHPSFQRNSNSIQYQG
jgi:hypothetical protein